MTAPPDGSHDLTRGGAAAGARPPRLRGVRRAAGDRDPAGRLPARPHAAARARAGRAAATCRAPRCARRWPRCAGRTGRDHPRPRRRHRGHAAGRGTPSGARPPPGSPAHDVASGSTPWTSGGRRARRRRTWPPAHDLDRRDARPQLEQAARRRSPTPPASRPRTGRPTPGFHLTIASLTGSPRLDRGGHLGAVHPARDAAGDPGARAPTSPTPTASTADLVTRDPRRARPTGPAR